MKDGPDIATIAALLGDPGRANMLTALMGGQALTAGELAREAVTRLAVISILLSLGALMVSEWLIRRNTDGRAHVV